MADAIGDSRERLTVNADPLKVVKVATCRVCRKRAPWCSCGAMDYEDPDEHLSLIGSEWEDRDPREQGRRIQIVGIDHRIGDGHNGPVFDAICIANQHGNRVGRKTQVGLHGLRKRWRRVEQNGSNQGGES
jgi:hypothetical protein